MIKKQEPKWIIITGEFIVFAGLIALLHFLDNTATATNLFIEVFLLTSLLLISVILTIKHSSKLQHNTIINLQKELSAEKREYRTIQAQFDEAIEKRTFELQRVNGALNREIAERIQAEEEVRGLQKQLHLILDSAGEGILGLDNQGKVIFMNKAASLMLGWEPDELIGNTHHELIHHTHADGSAHPVEICPIYMAYQDGQVHYKTGDIFWCKNGTSFPVEYVSTPIRDRGMLTGAVVVFRDMNTYK
ncbi:MAG: PAS domain-containing protein [Desulfobulbaceae bacterium]|nr:PAS domain-containing protein [Desulfobulbaceae bacterium]